MKRKRLALIILLALACVLCTVFAFGCSDKATYYTVTFMDGQTQVGESVKVQKGKKIADYPTAARSDENYVFDGWFKDEELNKVWNGDIERVTKDITLWANFLYVPATPSNVAMGGGAFSNTVTWLQRNITADTDFTVEIVGTDITSGGKAEFAFESYKGHTDIYTVQWTPAQKPLGGVYSVKIKSGTDDGETYENLMFKGAGVEQNPYLITSATDLAAVNAQDIAAGYYKLAQSFTARLSANEVAGKTFNGNLNGNGKTITLEASDIGLFGTLGQNAEVKDLTVAGAVANVQTNCVGAIASVNRGKITYSTVSASLDSAVGSVGTLSGDKDGIEGGIAGVAGINYGEISCCTYSGTVKANVGGAGIAVINNGTVSLCSFTGTIGAGNSNETGNSTKAYSYIGGIVAINYKVVEKSSTDGSGKLLAQRGEGGLNDYVGGIVAVNQANATVSECWFDGIRVHGNKNVGGIAGVNAGTVTHCYAGGDYHGGNVSCHSYVGGMSEVGGIVGLSQSGGTVTNCFVTSNVYAYSGNAYKVAQIPLNSVYVGGNLDNRSGTVAVKADENNGNIAIALSGDFSGKDYPLVLTDEQLSALNGESQLFTDKTNVRLVCEDESTVIEHSLVLSIDGTEIATLSSVSGNSVSLKEYSPENVPAGHYFAGWAVTENGQAVFEENAQVNYTALANYGAERVTLYPVFIEGEKPQSKVLNVAVYARYVNEDIIKDLLANFKVSALFEGFEDVHYTLVGNDKSNNAAFQAGVKEGNDYGAYNIAIGFRNALDVGQSQTLDLRILNKAGEALETRQVGLIGSDDVVVAFGQFLETETAKKIMNPAFVTEDEADKIQITLMNGDTQYGEKLTVSNATEAKKVTLPTIEDIPTGYVSFLGWATTQTAVENETLLTGSIGYSEVESLTTGGALTLYARFSEEEKPEVVVSVAVYNRYIGEQKYASDLAAAFCTANGYGAEEVVVDFLGESSTGAADFGALVNAGKYDIVLACGNNINTTCGVTIQDKKTVTVKGQTNRYIAILTQTGTAQAFYEFVETDAGKKALNPDYVTEAEADNIEITLMNGDTQYGEKLTVSNATDAAGVTLPAVEGDNFAGWAITQTAVENETLLTGNKSYADLSQYATEQKLTLYARFTVGEDPQSKILNIAVYGKFMLDETAENLINTFKTTYATELDGITVKYTIITKADATNNAAFAEKVLAGDAGDKYDIAIGYKHTSKAPVEVGQTENLTVNMYNKDSATENEARHVCIIGNDESAATFIEFLNTDAAKEILLTKPVEETA